MAPHHTTVIPPGPVICPGSIEFVHEDHVDGNHVTLCPVCGRFTIAEPIPDSHYLAVKAHRLIVHPDLGPAA